MDKPDINAVEHHYAGVLLLTADGRVIGQRRDNKPNIDNPNKIGTFGGTVESGESPRRAAWRELVKEETNLQIEESSIQPFYEDVARRKLTKEWEGRHFFYTTITEQYLEHMEVYEGQGWAVIHGADDPDLIELWRPVVRLFFDKLSEFDPKA